MLTLKTKKKKKKKKSLDTYFFSHTNIKCNKIEIIIYYLYI